MVLVVSAASPSGWRWVEDSEVMGGQLDEGDSGGKGGGGGQWG